MRTFHGVLLIGGVFLAGGILLGIGLLNSINYIERQKDVSVCEKAADSFLIVQTPETSATPEQTEIGIDSESENVPQSSNLTYSVDWDSLLSINSDIYAWLSLDTTTLSYPVLAGDKYLYHDYTGEDNSCGSLFTEDKSTFLEASNITIYGHHIPNKDTLFGKLFPYKEDPDYILEHPVFTIYTPKETLTYTVFSVFNVNVSTEGAFYAQGSFVSDQELSEFFVTMQEKSMYSINLPNIPEDLHLLTLSTCDRKYNSQGGRFVVMAVLTDIVPTEEA